MRIFNDRVLDKFLDMKFNGKRNFKGKERQIIKLIFFEKKTYKEIGDIMGISQSAVRKIKQRALEKLKKVPRHEFFKETLMDDDMGYSSFDYSSVTTPPRECLSCGVDVGYEKKTRRCRDCEIERLTTEMAIYKKRTPRNYNVYRKTWEKEHGPIPKGMQIHHIDGDHTNNSIENLKLVTPQQHYEIHYNQGDYLAAHLIKSKFLKK